MRVGNFQSFYARQYLDQSMYVGSIDRHYNVPKPQFTTDDYLTKKLIESNIDVDTLREQYSLTPMSEESVYKDFSKYHDQIDLSQVDFDAFNVGASWYFEWIKKSCKRRPVILNYDEVVILLNKPKSATVFFSDFFHNKSELLDNDEFKDSFIKFVHAYCKGDEDLIFAFKSVQKEEIRDTSKIQQLKLRSIIVGPIYLIMLAHMFFSDLDEILMENWLQYGSGIGMSFFFGDYNQMIEKLLGKEKYWFFDIGRYDSRQHPFLHSHQTQVINCTYPVRFVSFFSLLGSLGSRAVELGLENFKFDSWRVRHQITYDTQFSFVIMPRGEIYRTDRGEKSGGHRTSAANTGNQKLVEFSAASKFYNSLQDYIRAGFVNFHTGDDNVGGGPNDTVPKLIVRFWKQLGASVDVRYVSSIEQCDYLSSVPIFVDFGHFSAWLPLVNSAKVISGLCNKHHTDDPDITLQRVVAALILCYWTEDRLNLQILLKLFLSDYPKLSNHPCIKSHDEIVALYVGSLEVQSVR